MLVIRMAVEGLEWVVVTGYTQECKALRYLQSSLDTLHVDNCILEANAIVKPTLTVGAELRAIEQPCKMRGCIYR